MYVNITSGRAWLAPLSNYFVEIFRSVNWNDLPGLLLRSSILKGNGAIQLFLLRHPYLYQAKSRQSHYYQPQHAVHQCRSWSLVLSKADTVTLCQKH